MGERLEEWAPRTSAVLRRVPELVRAVLLERLRRWVEEARRAAPVGRGELARAIDGRATGTEITVTMPAEYQALEHGGTIRPRQGRWLAVPIAPAAELLPGPRSDVGLFVVRRRDGRLFLASRLGGAIEMRWRLVREITLRARGFMAAAAARADASFPDALLDHLTAELG